MAHIRNYERTEKVSPRQAIPPLLRQLIIERDEHCCVHCGATELDAIFQIDHLLPVTRGGTNEPHNLVTACRWCNARKGNMTLDEWDAYERAHGSASLVAMLTKRARKRETRKLRLSQQGNQPAPKQASRPGKFSGSLRRRGLLEKRQLPQAPETGLAESEY